MTPEGEPESADAAEPPARGEPVGADDPAVQEEPVPDDKPRRARRRARRSLSGWASALRWPLVGFAVFAAAAGLLWATEFKPAQLYGMVRGPTGKIYVSSPGVYTRERLVNDRNDQDYWLRAQLEALDEDEIRHTSISVRTSEVGNAAASDAAGEPGGMNATVPVPGEDGAPKTALGTIAGQEPVLSFMDAYTVRAAARDVIRQSILENLLDDRHDLTGNSVYGLKFDTTVYPSSYAQGRAYVRITITAGESEVLRDDEEVNQPEEKPEFQKLPRHLREYYKNYQDIETSETNFNYNSFKLYSQWLANVEWRLNSHFSQVKESYCTCGERGCKAIPANWNDNLSATVATILATDIPKIVSPDPADFQFGGTPSDRFVLEDPWNDFLQIVVERDVPGCASKSKFEVLPTRDMVHVGPHLDTLTEEQKNSGIPLLPVDTIDEKRMTYVLAPPGSKIDTSLYELMRPKYRNVSLIAKYVESIGKLADCDKSETICLRPIDLPSGYFNFIEKVIQPDMYAYSLFPRMEAASVLSGRNNRLNLEYPAGTEGAARYGLRLDDRTEEARLEPLAVGFTDAKTDNSINLGWVIGVEGGGTPFQKSQFALISVPAWTSKLSVKVTTGWLGSNSEEEPDDSFSYDVPIPPDYEAFDAFIGGEEAVRRPQINNELMDPTIKLVACRRAAILVPGLRLWRSSMVTIGSERADRITVLPNMRGIIAEFTKLPRPVEPGPATLRVWTSEGVDTQQGKIEILLPDNPDVECADKPKAVVQDIAIQEQPTIPPETPPTPENWNAN